MHSCSEILNHSHRESPALALIQLKKKWPQIIGPEWGKISSPAGYKNNCLIVRLPSSCHIQTALFEKEMLLSKINQSAHFHQVQDIRFIL